MKTILFTGFEPFGGSKVNPSIEACRLIEGKSFNGVKVAVEEIPLRFSTINEALTEHIEKHSPQAVVCTGQSGRPVVSLERVAINVADARIPYNCGTQPRDQPIEADGPAAYFSTLPLRGLLESLQGAGIPSEISNTAGTFGCNQIFYHLMHHREAAGLEAPAGFIHVPPLPMQAVKRGSASMTVELTARALVVVAERLSVSR